MCHDIFRYHRFIPIGLDDQIGEVAGGKIPSITMTMVVRFREMLLTALFPTILCQQWTKGYRPVMFGDRRQDPK
jgi:hypothetical protein